MMKHTLLSLAFVIVALPAQAACYADYKAKQDDPLQLHYGVVQLPDRLCDNKKRARRQIADRIAVDGWVLLKIQSFFGTEGLEERIESAGDYYLRY